MQAVVQTRSGGPEVLEAQDRPEPELGERDVRIAVRAAGVNFADIMARVGLYPPAPKPPCVLGYELSGVVEEVGEGVFRRWRGRRSWSTTPRLMGPCTSSAVCATATGCSSTPPPVEWASPRPSWPATPARRSSAQHRRASTRRSAGTACSTRSTTEPPT